MSRRLMSRGRYPKVPAVDQITSNSSQYSQASPVPSEIPGYPPVQSQPAQNLWNQSHYPNPSIYQPNQAPLVSDSNSVWPSQVYSSPVQPSNSWSWPAGNNTGNPPYPNNQPQPNNFQQPNLNYQQRDQNSTYQQPYVPQPGANYQQFNSNYQQPLQLDPTSQQIDPNYQQHQKIDPIFQQHPQLGPISQSHQHIDSSFQQPQQLNPNSRSHQSTDSSFQQHQQLNPTPQTHRQFDPSFQQHTFDSSNQLINPDSQQQPNLSFQNSHQPDSNFKEPKQSDPNFIQHTDFNHHQEIGQIASNNAIGHEHYALKQKQNDTWLKDREIEKSVEQTSNNLGNYDGWDEASLSIADTTDLPWTYSAPQYSNTTTSVAGLPPNSLPPVNFGALEAEVPSSPLSYLPNESSELNATVDEITGVPLEYVENESKDDNSDSSGVNDFDTSSIVRDLTVDADYGANSLSAFFQNSDLNNSANTSDYGGASTSDVRNVLDSNSLEENLSHLQISENERSLVPTEDEQDEDNLEDTFCGNQEINFLEEENSNLSLMDGEEKESVTGFVEEPINQEVPEPNTNESVPQSQVAQVKQDYHEMTPEEPFNQEIPVGAGNKSRSTSSERVLIRPREESPFKPPRMNGVSKGTVVQQEISVSKTTESKSPERKTVVQEVNLETFPDNLERPPDYNQLRKQSSFYVAHQKHLRTELNSSPSTLLCDNPDISCVTLAPAAPPIHSSSKSDKSESSSDSRREMSTYEKSARLKNNLKEAKTSLPANVDSAPSEKSYCSDQSYAPALKEVECRSTGSINKVVNNSQPEYYRKEPNYQQPSNNIKESSIKDVRHPENYPKPMTSMENLQNPNSNLDYSSRNSDYTPSRHSTDPRYSQREAEYNRQNFADRKYPSFDERQYFSDRERSRPPSRTSLDDRSEDYRYPVKPRDPRDYQYPPHDDRRHGHPDYDRPPSRMSESDMRRLERHGQYDYYKQSQPYPYSGQYPKNPDYYQKPPAYRGYDYDPYRRDPYYASYYDAAYRNVYNNYNYGFYDELYGNDPRYRQYQEQYKQYYAKYGYEGDYERSSAHSGRSSANDLTKDISSIQYTDHDLSSNASEISAYNIRQDYSYDEGSNDVSVLALDQSSSTSARLTPVKFSYAHPIACFSPGGILITAIPSQVDSTLSAPIKIQTMQALMENEESYEELKSYQGPLIRGLTHKNDVIEFCNQKIKVLRTKEDVVDRDSYILLWELAILMLRQNGSVVGSDIAELLLNDHEVLRPHGVQLRHTIETPQSEHGPVEVNDSSSQSHAGDTSSPDEGIVVLHDKSSLNASKTVDVDKVTRKFREFLLFGHKKDALEWAIKHDLWGHALFLASKMDLRTYANVMTRFANSLVLNDPLQTLYQLMSGRQPSAVTCVADKKWGDWRPHLAMILSNPSGLPDVDSRSITTLGDTLASRGCLPAAHFCYIMAQVEFGTFEDKSSKMVLLSSDHRLPFEEFATNEAIQCTEIYEYAQSLANPSYSLIHLQMYKFIYALRLVEHGFLEEALHYCEEIARRLLTHPVLYSFELISEVFKLASQLKYHDPHFFRGHGEYEDQDDPEWLQKFENLVKNYNNIVDEQNSQTQYEPIPEMPPVANDPMSVPTESASYQNVSQLGMQTEMSNSMSNGNLYQQTAPLSNTANMQKSQPEMHSYYQNDHQQMYNSQNVFQFEGSMPSHEENETTDVPSSPVTQTPPFDYYSSNTQQVSDSRHSSFDQVNNYATSTTHRERRDSAMSSGSRYSAGSLSAVRKPPVKETPKQEPKKESKPSSQAGKTWLGGIFSRLLPKAPNQMILPDDKNPTIVWDESSQKWVNKDSNDEDEINAPLAPPTDMELMGSKSSEKPIVPPGSSVPPVATSSVNKFQRPKTRGMRQNYVDVLNNSGATTKTSIPPDALFPAPFEQSTATSMFVPQSASNVGENSEMESAGSFNNSSMETEEPPPQALSTPLMFDPAEFDSRRANLPSQRHGTIGRAGRRTYPT